MVPRGLHPCRRVLGISGGRRRARRNHLHDHRVLPPPRDRPIRIPARRVHPPAKLHELANQGSHARNMGQSAQEPRLEGRSIDVIAASAMTSMIKASKALWMLRREHITSGCLTSAIGQPTPSHACRGSLLPRAPRFGSPFANPVKRWSAFRLRSLREWIRLNAYASSL